MDLKLQRSEGLWICHEFLRSYRAGVYSINIKSGEFDKEMPEFEPGEDGAQVAQPE